MCTGNQTPQYDLADPILQHRGMDDEFKINAFEPRVLRMRYNSDLCLLSVN